jgi:hypothetical protein
MVDLVVVVTEQLQQHNQLRPTTTTTNTIDIYLSVTAKLPILSESTIVRVFPLLNYLDNHHRGVLISSPALDLHPITSTP